jgi:hypothetical protein
MANSMNKWMGLSWVQLLSHVISSLFTEDLKEHALIGTAYKLHYWFCYIDDKFMIVPMILKDWKILWNTWTAYTTSSSSPWERQTSTFAEDQVVLWVIWYTGITATQTSTWMCSNIAQQICNLCCPLQHARPNPSAARTVSKLNFMHLKEPSVKMIVGSHLTLARS